MGRIFFIFIFNEITLSLLLKIYFADKRNNSYHLLCFILISPSLLFHCLGTAASFSFPSLANDIRNPFCFSPVNRKDKWGLILVLALLFGFPLFRKPFSEGTSLGHLSRFPTFPAEARKMFLLN